MSPSAPTARVVRWQFLTLMITVREFPPFRLFHFLGLALALSTRAHLHYTGSMGSDEDSGPTSGATESREEFRPRNPKLRRGSE